MTWEIETGTPTSATLRQFRWQSGCFGRSVARGHLKPAPVIGFLDHRILPTYSSVIARRLLERASVNYSETFKGKFGRGGLKTLKAFRDIFMAHSLMKKSDARPMYNNLFRLTDSARDFVQDARLAVTGDNLSLEDLERIYLNNAAEFWRMALLGERHDEFAMDG